MAREEKSDECQFDIEGLRQLMELMEKHDVREVKFQRGDVRYVLRRGPQEVFSAIPAGAAGYGPGAAAVIPSPEAAGGAARGEAGGAAGEENLVEIKSPTVGTFYQAQSPGDPAFIKVGDQVSPETVVCIVEAMKVFNQIPAGVSGTVAKILINDGDSVEYGQPMFLVKPA